MWRELIRGVGRHSRKGPEAKNPQAPAAPDPGGERGAPRSAPGNGRRRRAAPAPPGGEGNTPFGEANTPFGEGDTPFHDAPQVRGGHPEQREPGGGWGAGPQSQAYGDQRTPGRPGVAGPSTAPGGRVVPGQAGQPDGCAPAPGVSPRQEAVARQVSAQRAAQRAADGRVAARPAPGGGPLIPGPRREFVDAFDAAPQSAAPQSATSHSAASQVTTSQFAAVQSVAAPVTTPPSSVFPAGPNAPVTDGDDGPEGPAGDRGGPGAGDGKDGKGGGRSGRGRTFTGIAAAAVTTVLAVVVAGQVAQDSEDREGAPRTAGVDRDGSSDASRSDARPAPAKAPEVKPLSYAEKMAEPYPLDPKLKASGKFEAVPGLAKAPGKGQKYRYRIDVEKGLALDAGLFAEAVQKTLNDDRSWAHGGAMTFERISSGEPDFVITLASPGTTGDWCSKSGLDTTIDNVSCDSAATDRVMINAYRWAQGSSTYGPDKLLTYRQMLINHEVGHRLGHDHASCDTPGALAPVMQQQTKSLNLKGIKCKANPWVHPGS
ncbi:DUF3152 domain-containing protein [Streptomyces sp. NBC_01433]|uniref:DUF3152 domain-containing protein n=1 Tax=Streptomyces sp. NBC_01433 TaxID=2903864 RepID=UPI00224CC07A|nr:DUF3152 domain-containing protein [Streptomyces sp. NBC_01433]MCX4674453.1 DUF3152 domain-containing protein [Streptomyces sp. NBC_01433]